MIPLRSLVPTLAALALAGCATTQPTNPAATAHVAVLNSGAGVQEKARALQELAVVGGPEAVPALAALLSHEQLSDYARSGLESIKHPSAGAALRNALGTLNGRQLAGVVNSLGVRRETAAVRDLQALVFDTQRGVGAEAIASLGMIANSDAAKTLQKVLGDGPADLRLPAAHAALIAAEHLAKGGNVAAARGLLDQVVKALPPGHLATVAQNQAASLGAVARR
jgi:HEAT repeat protein